MFPLINETHGKNLSNRDNLYTINAELARYELC